MLILGSFVLRQQHHMPFNLTIDGETVDITFESRNLGCSQFFEGIDFLFLIRFFLIGRLGSVNGITPSMINSVFSIPRADKTYTKYRGDQNSAACQDSVMFRSLVL